MKNRKIFGAIVALIISCVAILGALSVSSSAEEGAIEQTSQNSPEIVSKNLSYSAYLHIHYAIPVDTVKDGYTPVLRFYKNEPTSDTSPYAVVTEYEVQTISVISGAAEKYYVFKSPGVAAKNMGDTIYAVPVAVAENDEIIGEASEYSVAEYLYERLYKNDFVSKTASDGEDFLRKSLYEALLEYGRAAQKVLIEDKLGVSVQYVTDYNYFAVAGSSDFGFFEVGDSVVAPQYEGTAAKGYKFGGWNIVSYVDGVGKTIATVAAGERASLPSGAVVMRPNLIVYDEILAQEGRDDVYVAQKWAELEAVAGTELTDAFKTLYTLYGDDMSDWSASLFSKGFNDIADGQWAGGYYASTGGRDTVGIGPDVQCTEQMFRFILQSGMLDQIGGSVASNLPDWVGYQVVYFVKSLQSKSNGYFYHPQWGQTLTDQYLSRRGRDLGWATSLLDRFDSAPTYDTPNGISGDGITADEYLLSLVNAGLVDPSDVPDSFAEKYLTGTLSVSASSAVSRVILVDVVIEDSAGSDNTGHLKSYVGFINYMLSTVIPGMSRNPYSMGNEISSIQSEIKTASGKLGGTAAAPTPYVYTAGDEANTPGATAADYMQFDGMTMMEIAIHGLNKAINTEIGLWGQKSEKNPTGTEFLFTNGFMKAMAIYNDYGATYPYPVAAAKALMTGLLSDEPSTGNICEVYNVWTAIDRLQSNIKNYFDSDAILEEIDGVKVTAEMVNSEINKVFAESAPEAVLNSYRKILGYKKEDGGFGHSYFTGTANHQGLTVSNGANVSDVDATCIGSTGLTREIFAALGLTKYTIPIFTLSDWMRYVSILEGADPVRKGTQEDARLTFTDNTVPEDITVESGNIEIGNYEGSGALIFKEAAGSKLIIARSNVSSIGSVICFMSDITLAGAGDFYVEMLTEEDAVYGLTLRMTETGLLIVDSVSGESYSTVGILPGITFNIKVEVQITGYEESGELLATYTTYINGESLCNTTCHFDAEKISQIKRARITQVTAGKIVLDNLTFVMIMSRSVVDFENQDIYEDSSAKLDIGGITAIITEQEKSECLVYTVTENANKYLRFDKIYGSGSVPSSQSYAHYKWGAIIGDTLIFETKMRLDNTSNSNSLKLNLRSGSETIVWQMVIGNNYVRTYANGKTADADESLSSWGIKEGEWFNFKLVITTTSSGSFTAVTYIDGTARRTSTVPYGGFVAVDQLVDFGVIPDMGWIGTIDLDDMNARGAEKGELLEDCVMNGELTFDSFAEGSWTVNTAGGVLINHYMQSNALGSTTVVSENGEKFFRMEKSGCVGSGSQQSWLVMQRTSAVSSNEALILQMTLRHDQVAKDASYLRFYNGRTAENGNNGTAYGSGASRNISFRASGGYVTFNDVSLGVAEGEWFTLRLVLEGQTVSAFVKNEDGRFVYITSVTRTDWADLSACTAVVLMNDSTTCHTTDIKSVYFGGLPEYISLDDEPSPEIKIPVGAATFDDIEEGAISGGRYGDITVGYVAQTNATASISVVADGEDKVLSVNKSANGTTSAQTWMNVGIAEGVSGTRYFQTRMKVQSWTDSGGLSYLRLYKGRNVASDGGTNISGNINLKADGSGVTVGGVQTGADVGEWFTLRIAMTASGYTISVLLDGEQSFKDIINAENIDLSACDVVTHMTTNPTVADFRFDYIYFGGEPSYE